ncbi:MAG: sigE [Haloplasmataceae bacterium]|jgi:RNA polymerase sporulation-specific sigma factor|nr:sigE [Haloplasmataceae bacterium]
MLKLIFKLIDFLLKFNTLFFVNSNEVLPEPLSPEEEMKYIDAFNSGDMRARDKLIEHNLRLVVYIAKKFENSGIYIEDLISIGSIGLIKSVQTYNKDKNIKLATYASRCIENEILMFLRKNGRMRTEVSFDEPLNIDWDGNELLLSDILGTEDNIIMKDLESNEEKKILYQAVNKLNKREREIIILRFGLFGNEEKTQKEVAELMGISQSYISRLEKKIIDKMKQQIKKGIN